MLSLFLGKLPIMANSKTADFANLCSSKGLDCSVTILTYSGVLWILLLLTGKFSSPSVKIPVSLINEESEMTNIILFFFLLLYHYFFQLFPCCSNCKLLCILGSLSVTVVSLWLIGKCRKRDNSMAQSNFRKLTSSIAHQTLPTPFLLKLQHLYKLLV